MIKIQFLAVTFFDKTWPLNLKDFQNDKKIPRQFSKISTQHTVLPTAAAAAKSRQSCRTLCDRKDSSPPGSAVPGIFQARTGVGCHVLLQGMKVKSKSEVAQSCLTLHDPMDCSLPGSTHGIFQARVLEWVAIAFS